jgi:spore germination protein GerM
VKKNSNNAKGILLLAFVLFAVVVGALVFRKYETATRKVEPPPQAAPAGTFVATLFFGAADGEGLVREGREVEIDESVEESIENVVDELIRGPVGSHAPALPPNAKVLGVRLKGDLAEIDFGPELLEGIPSGSSAETVAVYSIIDTVTVNFPQIKAVRFLVAGASLETLKGHLDLRAPLPPDFSLEKKEPQQPQKP